MDQEDTILFMTSFKISEVSKKVFFCKNRNIQEVLEKYHIENLIFLDRLITRHGSINFKAEYDDVTKETAIRWGWSNNDSPEKFNEDIEKLGWFLELLNSKNNLLDKNYFNLNAGLNYERFLATIDSVVYQVNPIVYLLNNVLYITFELINFEEEILLKKNDLIGKYGYYSMLPVTEYCYFSIFQKKSTNNNLSNIILSDILDFFEDVFGYKFDKAAISYVYNIGVLREVNTLSDKKLSDIS